MQTIPDLKTFGLTNYRISGGSDGN